MFDWPLYAYNLREALKESNPRYLPPPTETTKS